MEASSRRPAQPGDGLERCRSCLSTLVYPLSWRRVGDDQWSLRLRCPECGRTWREKRSTAEVKGFDRALSAGREVLEQHLQEIERLEREAEIDRFAHALAADAILPEDFAP